MSGVTVRAEGLSNPKLAFTNLAFLNPDDFAAVAGDATYVPVRVFNTVFLVQPRPDVPRGVIQLNQLQRHAARVSLSDEIPLAVVPLESLQPLSSVTLTLELLSKGKGTAAVALDSGKVADKFRTNFAGHVFRLGQDVAMDFEGTPLKLTVVSFSHVELDGATPRASDEFAVFGSMSKGTSVQLEKGKDANITLTGGTVYVAVAGGCPFLFSVCLGFGADARGATPSRRRVVCSVGGKRAGTVTFFHSPLPLPCCFPEPAPTAFRTCMSLLCHFVCSITLLLAVSRGG